jgi:hypothetical protein
MQRTNVAYYYRLVQFKMHPVLSNHDQNYGIIMEAIIVLKPTIAVISSDVFIRGRKLDHR